MKVWIRFVSLLTDLFFGVIYTISAGRRLMQHWQILRTGDSRFTMVNRYI